MPLVLAFLCAAAFADVEYTDTAKPTADAANNMGHQEGTPYDIDANFTKPKGELPDLIEVQNTNVEGLSKGVYCDPIDDNARLSWVVKVPAAGQKVQVKVEGREGIGAIYWVTVTPTGGGGGQGGQRTILWGDVQDMNRPGALVLKDTNTGAGKSDTTDSTTDTPTLYCTGPLPAGTGTVEIRLNAESGTYDWEIQGSSYSGVFDGTYVTTQPGIAPGTYTLVVTSRNDPTFCRAINFCVIEYGQYLPASYPEEEIDVTEVTEDTTLYYEVPGEGEIRSITVSAPVDGDEGATNPYEYGDNYTITIDPEYGTATVSLSLPGVYMLRIVRDDGDGLIETYHTLAYSSESGIAPVSEWPVVLIVTPHWNYNLVFDKAGDAYLTNGWNSITLNPKAKYDRWFGPAATSVESLVQAKYAALGNKAFDLAIVTHGVPASVEGDVWLNKNNVVAVLGNKITGKVKRIRFYSCRAGKLPDGGTLLQNLKNAANATQTSSYISYTWNSTWPHFWSAGKWGDKTVK